MLGRAIAKEMAVGFEELNKMNPGEILKNQLKLKFDLNNIIKQSLRSAATSVVAPVVSDICTTQLSQHSRIGVGIACGMFSSAFTNWLLFGDKTTWFNNLVGSDLPSPTLDDVINHVDRVIPSTDMAIAEKIGDKKIEEIKKENKKIPDNLKGRQKEEWNSLVLSEKPWEENENLYREAGAFWDDVRDERRKSIINTISKIGSLTSAQKQRWTNQLNSMRPDEWVAKLESWRIANELMDIRDNMHRSYISMLETIKLQQDLGEYMKAAQKQLSATLESDWIQDDESGCACYGSMRTAIQYLQNSVGCAETGLSSTPGGRPMKIMDSGTVGAIGPSGRQIEGIGEFGRGLCRYGNVDQGTEPGEEGSVAATIVDAANQVKSQGFSRFNENGEFGIEFQAPSTPGEYNLRVTAASRTTNELRGEMEKVIEAVDGLQASPLKFMEVREKVANLITEMSADRFAAARAKLQEIVSILDSFASSTVQMSTNETAQLTARLQEARNYTVALSQEAALLNNEAAEYGHVTGFENIINRTSEARNNISAFLASPTIRNAFSLNKVLADMDVEIKELSNPKRILEKLGEHRNILGKIASISIAYTEEVLSGNRIMVPIRTSSGFTGTVAVSISGLQPGTYSLSPVSGTPDFTSILTVDTSKLQPGEYIIKIDGRSSSLSATANFSLYVYDIGMSGVGTASVIANPSSAFGTSLAFSTIQKGAPLPKTFTITNTGNSQISWTAAKSAAWLNIGQTGGTLDSSQSATVVISIINTNLNVGTHTATVTLTASNGNTATIPVTLTITCAGSHCTNPTHPFEIELSQSSASARQGKIIANAYQRQASLADLSNRFSVAFDKQFKSAISGSISTNPGSIPTACGNTIFLDGNAFSFDFTSLSQMVSSASAMLLTINTTANEEIDKGDSLSQRMLNGVSDANTLANSVKVETEGKGPLLHALYGNFYTVENTTSLSMGTHKYSKTYQCAQPPAYYDKIFDVTYSILATDRGSLAKSFAALGIMESLATIGKNIVDVVTSAIWADRLGQSLETLQNSTILSEAVLAMHIGANMNRILSNINTKLNESGIRSLAENAAVGEAEGKTTTPISVVRPKLEVTQTPLLCSAGESKTFNISVTADMDWPVLSIPANIWFPFSVPFVPKSKVTLSMMDPNCIVEQLAWWDYASQSAIRRYGSAAMSEPLVPGRGYYLKVYSSCALRFKVSLFNMSGDIDMTAMRTIGPAQSLIGSASKTLPFDIESMSHKISQNEFSQFGIGEWNNNCPLLRWQTYGTFARERASSQWTELKEAIPTRYDPFIKRQISCYVARGHSSIGCPNGGSMVGGGCDGALDGCYPASGNAWVASGSCTKHDSNGDTWIYTILGNYEYRGQGVAYSICCNNLGGVDLTSRRVVSQSGTGSVVVSCNSNEILLGVGIYSGGLTAACTPSKRSATCSLTEHSLFTAYATCIPEYPGVDISWIPGSSCPQGTTLLAGTSSCGSPFYGYYPDGNTFVADKNGLSSNACNGRHNSNCAITYVACAKIVEEPPIPAEVIQPGKAYWVWTNGAQCELNRKIEADHPASMFGAFKRPVEFNVSYDLPSGWSISEWMDGMYDSIDYGSCTAPNCVGVTNIAKQIKSVQPSTTRYAGEYSVKTIFENARMGIRQEAETKHRIYIPKAVAKIVSKTIPNSGVASDSSITMTADVTNIAPDFCSARQFKVITENPPGWSTLGNLTATIRPYESRSISMTFKPSLRTAESGTANILVVPEISDRAKIEKGEIYDACLPYETNVVAVAANATNLIYSTKTSIESYDIRNCAFASTIATEEAVDIDVKGAQIVWIRENGDVKTKENGIVRKIGEAPNATKVALDNSGLFLLVADKIVKMNMVGDKTIMYSGLAHPQGLAIRGMYIYWTEGDSIRFARKFRSAGGNTECTDTLCKTVLKIQREILGPASGTLSDIVILDNIAFFVVNNTGFNAEKHQEYNYSKVMRIDLTYAGTTLQFLIENYLKKSITVLAKPLLYGSSVDHVATDGNYAYWVGDGSIDRINAWIETSFMQEPVVVSGNRPANVSFVEPNKGAPAGTVVKYSINVTNKNTPNMPNADFWIQNITTSENLTLCVDYGWSPQCENDGEYDRNRILEEYLYIDRKRIASGDSSTMEMWIKSNPLLPVNTTLNISIDVGSIDPITIGRAKATLTIIPPGSPIITITPAQSFY
jgi:hypothetical protein